MLLADDDVVSLIFYTSPCMMPNIVHSPVCLQVQRELTEVTSEAKSGQTVSLQFQIQEMQEQMKGVQDELKAAAAASHSAAKVGWRLRSS